VRRRLPTLLGKAEETRGARQRERDQRATGQHGRGPPKPRRPADQDQRRESERDAGLHKKSRADRWNVPVAMDVEIGMADSADGDRHGDADPRQNSG
jgi:hypothetical protein